MELTARRAAADAGR